MVLAMVVLGGLGSVPGVILGAVVLSLLPELLRGLPGDWTAYRMLFFGLAMLVIMLFRPQGLIGTLRRRLELRPVSEQIKMEEDEVLEEDREK
jgi:branched-chain amino acid transport system permease protein